MRRIARAAKAAAIIGMCVLSADAAAQMMPKMATNTPRLQLFQGDGLNFVLVDALTYEIKRTGQFITVPAGFVTDFASVPWYARSVINVLGRHSIPAIVHDYLYWEQRCTREQADAIMKEAMTEYESSSFDQNVVFYAIKYGAGGAWSQNAADMAKGLIRILPEGHRNIPLNTDWQSYRQKLFDDHVKEEPIPPGMPAYCKLDK